MRAVGQRSLEMKPAMWPHRRMACTLYSVTFERVDALDHKSRGWHQLVQ